MKNMKKILTITALSLALGTQLSFAQDAENKNFRFGLVIDPSVNWYKPDGKILAKNGAGMKFGGGVLLEFRLAKVASFQTGLRINSEGGKIKYNNGAVQDANSNVVNYLYSTADDEILDYIAPDSASTFYNTATIKGKTWYQLNERQYKVTYITIPLVLKLKTKEIGTMTYFGQFGINSSFRWKATANDNVTKINQATAGIALGATETKSKVDITKDVAFYKAALTFGAGAEMNLSGTTSLTFGLHYNLGFTNSVKSSSDFLAKRTNDADYNSANQTKLTTSNLPQTIKSNAVVLTVGVLF
jgi:outer membrane protein with beta-barrel domain